MMRTRIVLALVAGLACVTAGAANKEPALEFEAHYGTMYAGHTFVHVDLRGVYDERFMIHPKVWMEMERFEACTDDGCTTHSISEDFADPGPLIGVLTEARKHLADGTDFTYRLAPSSSECGNLPTVDVQVDGKARRMHFKLRFMEADFDADEVDYFLGLLQPAFDRLMIVQPQFDAFNAASPLSSATPTCGRARPATLPTAS